MPNKMLIDATHPEETRVVVVRGNRVEEFDFETAQRKQLRGNIYLAKVTRVEPSLQAAFIEYGGNRHGFLAFSEIHPDYYQIPVADRQALIEADERAHREAEEETESRAAKSRRPRHRNARRRGNGERIQSDIVDGAGPDALAAEPATHHLHADPGDEATHDPARHHDDPPFDAHDEPHDPDEASRGEDDHEAAGDDHSDRIAAGTHPERLEPVARTLTDVETDDHEAEPGHPDIVHEARRLDEPPRHPHADDAAHGEFAEDASPDEISAEALRTEALGEDASEGLGAEPHDDRDADPAGSDHAGSDHADHAIAFHGDDHPDDEDDDEAEEEVVESVGGDDVLEEVPERPFRPRRQYKIQEVIKRRQVMLVQVVKEERGNKGAALTTYLSLAGRYAVLMPNTARGGGISRKITSAQDRSRLKEVVQDLDVPEGMGIILRTAGASRTKPEIKRDFEYLIRMWETVRDMTLKSQAPTLVYEEGSLIKRSLRDLYNKEIDDILVAGDAGYHEARDFMKMLMPTNVRAVKEYRDGQPLFSRMGVESQLDAMFSPTVQLRSGGYIVINQTEALVSIDVNSGRSTREHHIEDTALKTNLEAADEVARQLRLRDLAGLIVIDFIDMDEKRNNRSVERKLSDCLRQDRARIQVGRISHFGLLEMSRQRIRASVLESSTEPCSQCGGSGHVRSVSSVALQLLRGLEEILMKGATHNLVVRTRTDVALYVLNHKRGHLRDLENSFKVSLAVIADATVSGQQSFVIDRGEQVHTLEAAKALLAAQVAAFPAPIDDTVDEDEPSEIEVEADVETEEIEVPIDEAVAGEASSGEAEADGHKRKRRRRRRGRAGETRETGAIADDSVGRVASTPEEVTVTAAEDSDPEDEEADDAPSLAQSDQPANGDRRPRRRGRRGGRRRRGGLEDGLAGSIADELGPASDPEAVSAVADFDGGFNAASPPEPQPEPISAPRPYPGESAETVVAHGPTADETAQEVERAARRRSTVREKVSFLVEARSPQSDVSALDVSAPVVAAPAPEAANAPASDVVPTAPAPESPSAPPRRAGWWSRRFGGGE
jgi:ribonuclease E